MSEKGQPAADGGRPSSVVRRRSSVDYLVLIAAQLAVGSAALMARAGLAAGLSPLALSAWRLTVAAAILLLFSLWTSRHSGRIAPLPPGVSLRLIVAGICLGLHFATWFGSLQHVSVARSTLLVNTSPIWAGLAGRTLLRQRLSFTFWPGVAIAGLGAYLVVAAPSSMSVVPAGNDSAAWLGDSLAVLGAIFIAAYLLLVQDLLPRYGTTRIVTWTYSAAAVSLWPLALLVGPPTDALPRSLPAWLSIVGMALIPQLMGHTALNWSLRRFPAGVVAATTLLEPVFAAGLARWLFAEPLTPRQGIGAAILLLGVGLALAPSNNGEEADGRTSNHR